METLDAQDLTLFLAYQHVMGAGMKHLGNQIYKLGVSAGLDLKSVNCDIRVKEVIEATQNIKNKIDTQSNDHRIKNLVYSYLRKIGKV